MVVVVVVVVVGRRKLRGRVDMAFYLLLFLNKNVDLFVCSGTLRLLVVNKFLYRRSKS